MVDIEAILISPMEAKKLLGVGRNEIYNLVKQKDFPSCMIGNKYYINKEKLKEWADKKCSKK